MNVEHISSYGKINFAGGIDFAMSSAKLKEEIKAPHSSFADILI